MAKPKTTQYQVELTHTAANGAKRTMWRGGRQFEVKVPQVLDLTDEEVKVYEDDKRFKLSTPGEASDEANEVEETSSSDSDSSDAGEASEEDTTAEDEASEDSSTDEAEEASDDTQSEEEVSPVDALVRDNSRQDLDAKAEELGVENASKMENKLEVAQAIVDAEARNSGEATS